MTIFTPTFGTASLHFVLHMKQILQVYTSRCMSDFVLVFTEDAVSYSERFKAKTCFPCNYSFGQDNFP